MEKNIIIEALDEGYILKTNGTKKSVPSSESIKEEISEFLSKYINQNFLQENNETMITIKIYPNIPKPKDMLL